MGMTREEAIKQLRLLKGDITFGIASKVENKNQIEALSIAIASLETDEAYQLEYESTTKNNLSSGTRKNSQKLENVSPIIDWNNCHTSEQLDSIATTKNDLGVDCVSRNDVERIIERDFGSCWNENDYYDRLLADLEELPPVTPQEPTEKCTWIKYDYRTMCPKEHIDVDSPYWRIPENRMETLKYCPYCGKEIEVEE